MGMLELKPSEFKSMKPVPRIKQKRCKVCCEYFTPRSSFAKVCGAECSIEYVRLEKAKKERQERQKGLQALKSRKDWEKEAQASVNAWVRFRDRELNCISCGQWFDGSWQAGHYLSRGARPNLALVEANIHKQCIKCNMHLSGNQAAFRIGLVEKIGLLAVEMLEADHIPRKYTADELKEIRDNYRAKLREAKKGIV